MYKPHIIIIIIVVNFIIVICLYNVMYFQYTSLSMASQITGVSIVCATVCSGAYQGKYQCATSLASVRGSHRWPVDSPHKGPVTWKIFLFDDVIMILWNIIIFKWISNKKTMVCFKYGIHKYLNAEWFKLLITLDFKAFITWSLG